MQQLELRNIRQEELEAWTYFCDSVFGVGQPYFMRHYQNDPYKDINGIFAAFDKDVIVSSVRVFTRYLNIEGHSIKIGGIGEVCTDVNYRRRGLSTSLLKMAIQYMQDNDMHLSLLHTGTNELYSKLGWFTKENSYKVFLMLPRKLPKGFDIRGYTKEDLPIIQKLFSEYAPKHFPYYTRTQEYYENWVQSELNLCYILFKDGQPVSYADCIYREKEKAMLVKEYIPGEHMHLMKSFLYSIKKEEKLPLLCAIPASFTTARSLIKIKENGQMFRINKPFNIGEELIEEQAPLLSMLTNFPILHIDAY